MKPLEPTSMVVRVAAKPFLLHLSTSSAYFARFRCAASSIPVSNGMVNSTMWMEESLQTTMSGRSSVATMFWGKVNEMLGRSAVILLSCGRCADRKEWMQPKTLSCLSLYRLPSRATVQLLSTWCRVCSLLQSWHCGEDIFFHRKRFLLCGSVSVTALRANLKARSGRDCTVVDHRSAALPWKSLTVWPWTVRPALWASSFSCFISLPLSFSLSISLLILALCTPPSVLLFLSSLNIQLV